MSNLLKSNSLLFFCEQTYKKAVIQTKIKKELLGLNCILYNISSKFTYQWLQQTVYKYMYSFFIGNLMILKPLHKNNIKLNMKDIYLVKLNNNLYLPYQIRKLKFVSHSIVSKKFIGNLLFNNKLLPIVLKKNMCYNKKISE